MVCPGTLFHRTQRGIPMHSYANRSQIRALAQRDGAPAPGATSASCCCLHVWHVSHAFSGICAAQQGNSGSNPVKNTNPVNNTSNPRTMQAARCKAANSRDSSVSN
jgi:hypothetical protein